MVLKCEKCGGSSMRIYRPDFSNSLIRYWSVHCEECGYHVAGVHDDYFMCYRLGEDGNE